MADVLAIRDVSKRYGATLALDAASFSCRAGEVHALIGENGAGKSTLIKILSGTVKPDAGSIRIDGEDVVFGTAEAALNAGISTAYQELTLVPHLSVGANLLLGREPRRRGVIRTSAAKGMVADMLREWGAEDISPSAKVSTLPLSSKQRIEIVRSFSRNAKVLLLDEPTSGLGAEGVDWFFAQTRKARAAGVAVVFVTHRIEEIREVADRLTVLREGRTVQTLSMADLDRAQLLTAMGGRARAEAAQEVRSAGAATGDPILEVVDLHDAEALNGVDFALHRGEVVGVSALEGHGQRELFMSLFGIGETSGTIRVSGSDRKIRSPRDAVRQGIGISLVPEDRQTEGVLNGFTGVANVSLPSLGTFSRFGLVNVRKERQAVREVFRQLNIAESAMDLDIASLSGGNQQKLIMAKWVLSDADILLLYDPTRGIDVATKTEIYALVREMVLAGKAVLFYSTDTEELLDLCDRVLVMYGGRVSGDIRGEQLTKANLLAAMFDTREEAA